MLERWQIANFKILLRYLFLIGPFLSTAAFEEASSHIIVHPKGNEFCQQLEGAQKQILSCQVPDTNSVLANTLIPAF